MKLPRDLSGAELSKALCRYGYTISRTTGSHIRLTTEREGQHHVTIPAHRVLTVGTLAAVLDAVARHHGVNRSELLQELFG